MENGNKFKAFITTVLGVAILLSAWALSTTGGYAFNHISTTYSPDVVKAVYTDTDFVNGQRVVTGVHPQTTDIGPTLNGYPERTDTSPSATPLICLGVLGLALIIVGSVYYGPRV